MYWHIDTDIVSLIVVTAVYIAERMTPAPGRASLRSVRFRRCLEICIAATAVDIAASVIMELPSPAFLYHLLMTLYFLCIELVMVEWFLYVLTILYPGDEKKRRAISGAVLGVYGLYALFVVSNPWTGVIYRLGPNNEYSRGPLFAMMIVLFSLYTLVLFALILLCRKRVPANISGLILPVMPIVEGAAVAAQLSIPGTLLIMPAYMVCLVLAYLFLQTARAKSDSEMLTHLARVAKTDPLTGLYNRSGMEAMVQKTLREAYGQSVMVLIADIDDLKAVNDGMGHTEGDRAIRLVAETLKTHFRLGDTVVRYGGDEFLAFFTGSFTPEQLSRSIHRLVQRLAELRVGPQDEAAIHCSVGAACGAVGYDSFEALCAKADIALYHVKRSGKNGYALYSPKMEQERE